jgi:tRNA (guanine-N7-)-methyltransferase
VNSTAQSASKVRSFVRREGRITAGQRRALETLWPKFGLETGARIDLDTIFGRQAPHTLEIGFGNGDALATMAEQTPDTDFLGIEVHRPGVGRLLLELERRGLTNVRLMRKDAVQVLHDCLPDGCLNRVLLFFPDPWHKKRHHKRRIVQPAFVELLAEKLATGGILHMATDWEHYAVQMLEVAEASPAFRNSAGHGQYAPRPGYRPITRFEQRGQRLGHGVWDLVFERIEIM